jgi:acyl dehydratase
MPEIYFEDFEVGDVYDEFATETVERDEMLEFASKYDPLAIHTDEAPASETEHGGVIASGWFTCCLTWRVIVDEFMTDVANVAGLALEEVRWPTAVRAGDTLHVRLEVVEKKPV